MHRHQSSTLLSVTGKFLHHFGGVSQNLVESTFCEHIILNKPLSFSWAEDHLLQQEV